MKPDEPSPVESELLELDLGPVGLADEGEGPVFVAIHGLPGGVRDFRWLAPALSGRARIVRLEMPGFGKTPAGRFGYDIDARGAFVAGVIEQLGLEEVVVLGHSMGGAVAVSAGLQSDRVRAVGLLASIGPEMHQGLRSIPFVRLGAYAMHLPGAERYVLPRWRSGLARMGFRGVPDAEILQLCFVLARVRFRTHRANLAALRKPTLVAWAADDPLVEDAMSDRLYWAAPVGPRIRFPTGGHNIQATRALELAEALLAWVQTLDAQPE